MKSGKFDEELTRMSHVVDHIVPDTFMLFNESFASTNEREGSEIGRQIVTALLERQVKVAFVTHQYEFAHGFEEKAPPNVLFLRADREADGSRSFKLREGKPLPTSFGEDLYRQIFQANHPRNVGTMEVVVDQLDTSLGRGNSDPQARGTETDVTIPPQ